MNLTRQLDIVKYSTNYCSFFLHSEIDHMVAGGIFLVYLWNISVALKTGVGYLGQILFPDQDDPGIDQNQKNILSQFQTFLPKASFILSRSGTEILRL